MKTIESPRNVSVRLHRDGTVSYWSTSQGRWIDRTIFVAAEELERMDPRERERVSRHLLLDEQCSPR